MDLDALRTFVAIARLGTFSRAAEALHRSQPAISRRIELLEHELKTTLFERLRGGAVLTDAGAALLPHAEAALAAVRDAAEAVDATTQGEAGTVSLAIVGTLANAQLTAHLAAFRRRHPGVRLNIQTATSQVVADLVQRGEANLGLRYLTEPRPGLTSKTVTEEPLVVVAGRDHPLADGRAHPPQALASERWVAFPARANRESFVQFLERRLSAAGLHDFEVVAIDSLTAQKRLVEAGFGIALMAEAGAEEELRAGALKRIDVPALRATIPISVVHRRAGYLSPAARTLLSTLDPSPE